MGEKPRGHLEVSLAWLRGPLRAKARLNAWPRSLLGLLAVLLVLGSFFVVCTTVVVFGVRGLLYLWSLV